MKILIGGGSLLLCTVLFSGCETGSVTSRESNRPKPGSDQTSQTVPTTASASPAGDSNQPIANANAATESPLATPRNRRLEAVRQAGNDPSVPQLDIEKILRQSTRPAPENSEFAVALTDILIERRTFSKHPVLVRIEKVTEGEKGTIRVQTKEGKVHELPGESIPALSTVPTSTILSLLKIELPVEPVSGSKPRAQAKN